MRDRLKNYGNWYLLPEQFQKRFKEQQSSPVKGVPKVIAEKVSPAREDQSSVNETPQLGPSHELDIKERIEKIKYEQKMERMAEI